MAGTQEANIAVRVGADLTPLQRDMKKASHAMGGFSKKAEAVSGVMKGMALAAVAAAGAIAVIAKASADAAREIKALAMVSNVSVENFQRLAFAARTVNVQQEKLADIFKDSQDKVGDFLATGGGPLKDYFENIAPLIGQTAKEFQYLSGPQILGKMQEGLDSANLSMAEQVFYLEAIASDASLLQPLLKNNAKGFNELANAADDLNLVLSESEIDNLNEMAVGFDKLATQIGTETSRAILQFDDEIKSAIEGASKGLNLLARGFNLFFEQFRSAENKKSIAGIDEGLSAIFRRREELNKILANPNIYIYADRDKAKAELADLMDGYTRLTNKRIELQKAGQQPFDIEEDFTLARVEPAEAGGDTGRPKAREIADEQATLDELQALRNEAAMFEWEGQQLAMASLEEAELEHFTRRAEMLQGFLSGQEGEYRHSAGAVTDIVKKGIGLQQATVVAGLASVLATTAGHNKKAFEINKKVALANASIQGVQSAINAWRSGMETGGPWAPAVAAAYTAASLAKTGAMISNIQSQSYGGGGSQSVGGGGSGGGALPGAALQQQTQQQPQNQIVSINLEGEVFGREQVRGLIGQINDALEDGFTLRV